MITIKHVLQYLSHSPNHYWKKFELRDVKYSDVDLLKLYYESDLTQCEVLYFETCESESGHIIRFKIFRNSTSIILEPILIYDINGLELFGSKNDEYHMNLFDQMLRMFLQVNIDFNILKTFINGE